VSRVYVSGLFDDVRSPQLRFFQEAARLGPLTILLWEDALAVFLTGMAPKFGLAERKYFLESLSYVDKVEVAEPLLVGRGGAALFEALTARLGGEPALWALTGAFGLEVERPSADKAAFCSSRGIEYRVIAAAELAGFPYEPPPLGAPRAAGLKRVLVTGSFDWLHSGHVRFFEEASALGELNVVVGHDGNIRLLKGEGHPLFSAEERRYQVGSMRLVKRALVSTGSGWLDAEPEILALRPERYLVNADGDRPEKRAYCERAGIEYIVLERLPKEGLPRRASTDLRGY
jgi:cytidyltransferase-like protein